LEALPEGTSLPGDELTDLIAPFSMKGLSGQNPAGKYLEDPREWGIRTPPDLAYQLEYMQWHQTYHKGVRDPRCTICKAEQDFQSLRAPHEQNHKGYYEPSCRFCQDDKFFGRK
jgi:hypothetical protein